MAQRTKNFTFRETRCRFSTALYYRGLFMKYFYGLRSRREWGALFMTLLSRRSRMGTTNTVIYKARFAVFRVNSMKPNQYNAVMGNIWSAGCGNGRLFIRLSQVVGRRHPLYWLVLFFFWKSWAFYKAQVVEVGLKRVNALSVSSGCFKHRPCISCHPKNHIRTRHSQHSDTSVLWGRVRQP